MQTNDSQLMRGQAKHKPLQIWCTQWPILPPDGGEIARVAAVS